MRPVFLTAAPQITELLFVSSEPTATASSLENEGFRVVAFRDCQQALQIAAERTFDAALVSTNCRHRAEFLEQLRAADEALQVLVLREPRGEWTGTSRNVEGLPNLHMAPRSTPLVELSWGLRQAAEITRLRRANALLLRRLKPHMQQENLPAASVQPQLCADHQAPPFSIEGAIELATITRGHVLAVLQQQGGNKARAARALGINRRSLYRLLEKYDASRPEPTPAVESGPPQP